MKRNFSTNELIMDERFQRWVLQNDPDAAAFWNNYLDQHPESASTVREAKSLLLMIDFKSDRPEESERAQVWEAIDQEINTTEKSGFAFRKIAAAILALIASVFVFYLVENQEAEEIVLQTDFAEMTNIILPDGSEVTLNANSSLRYDADWDEKNLPDTRQVWLDGEAFFDIQQVENENGKVKFLVHTNDLVVEVLGTSFNVSNRGKTTVVLKSGKVKIDLPEKIKQESILMAPGELVEFSRENEEVTHKTVNPDVYSAWTHNQLIFDNTPLSDVADIIENNYGYDVVIKDNLLKERRFNGTVSSEDLNILLSALSETFVIEITTEGNELIIKEK